MEGWIKIHREIESNPIFYKPNYLAVWMYLLLHANHTNKSTIINNQKVVVKRGQFIGSMRKISDNFGISISTVKHIIDYFKLEHMIEHQPNTKYSLFTVLNYDMYQDIEHSIEHQPNTSRTPAETTKNDKNVKNEKKESRVIFKKPTLNEISEYAQSIDFDLDPQRFYDYYESKGWMIGNNKMKNWQAAVRNWKARSSTSKQDLPQRIKPGQKL